MKKTFLLSISILFSFSVFSQNEFASEGAAWHYRSYFGWLGAGMTQVKLTGDTTIVGMSYKTLTVRAVTSQHDLADDIYIRQSADSIFRYFENGEQFLFKTKMEVGGIYSFPSLAGSDAEFEVMAVEILTVNGQEVREHQLKRINSSWDFEVKFYDRYGPEYGFFDYWLGSVADGNDHYLRCYEDDEFDQINLTNEDCDGGLLNDTDEATLAFLEIYPNPVSSILTIEIPTIGFPQNTLSVLDAVGRKIHLTMDNGQVDVSQLAAGMYIGRLETNRGLRQFKFVKN